MSDQNTINVFFAYSHKDRELREELEAHLSPLRRSKLIETWSDNELKAGEVWESEIQKSLEKADVILLLISADFLNSDYCYNIEMTKALERHEQKSTRVIPILLRSCAWETSPFAKLQCLPQDGNSISSKNRNKDEAFTEVVKGLKKSVDDLIQKKINDAEYYSLKERGDLLFQEKNFKEAKVLYERAYSFNKNPEMGDKIKNCNQFIRETQQEPKTESTSKTEQPKIELPLSDLNKKIEKIKYFKDNSLYEQGLIHSRELIKKVPKGSSEEILLKKYISYFSAMSN